MKKQVAAASMAMLLLSALTFSGCYPTEKRVETQYNTSANIPTGDHIDGNHFEYSKKNLTAEFDFPDIPTDLPSKIKLKEKRFDRQEMIDLFFDGKKPASEYTYFNGEYGQYTAENGAELIIEGNRLNYNYEIIPIDNSAVNYFSAVNMCKSFNRELLSIGSEEIKGFPLQEALDSAKELISKVGITGLGEPEIFSVSIDNYERLRSTEDNMFGDRGPLTEDYEMYVFRFPQLINGVKLADIRVDIKDHAADTDTLADMATVVVGMLRGGVFEFYAEAAYETDVEILSAEPIKYDFNHAVTELEKYFDKVVFKDSRNVTVNKSEVFYYPTERNEEQTMEFAPAWSFGGYSRDLVFEKKINHTSFWDFRFIVNTDVGVVREYSEV